MRHEATIAKIGLRRPEQTPLALLRIAEPPCFLPVPLTFEALVALSVIDTPKQDRQPTIHEVYCETLRSTGLELISVQITDITNANLVANAVLLQNEKVMEIGIHPGDAIALAKLENISIYVAPAVVRDRGVREAENSQDRNMLEELPADAFGDYIN